MLVLGSQPETLPVALQRDATTGLPLLHEQDAILQIILAYLALPYSVTEYGCGKKASLIIDHLLSLDIPAYAISRGMILERDMSPAALAETDFEKRPHALVADNPLYELGNTRDAGLRDMLEKNCPDVVLVDEDCVRAGPFYLRHAPRVQFVTARSHIYTIVTFWDDQRNCAVDRVIDPSLHRSEPFAVEHIRELLHAPEGLLFEAPLLGHFRLDGQRLTNAQSRRLQELGTDPDALETLSLTTHAELIRRLTGAEPGSLGDPDSWTYANNIRVSEGGQQSEKDHFSRQGHDTGQGDPLRTARRRLLEARRHHSGEASSILAELRHITEDSNLHRIVRDDAAWSQKQLEPLADAAMIFVYYRSLGVVAEAVRNGENILRHLTDSEQLQAMRGIGVRLRRRIDWLARVSMEDDGRIDARALRPGFVASVLQTIQQMNLAGLEVFVDRVGNLHGLQLNDKDREALRRGTSPRDFTRGALAHCSHLDTVNHGGKFDGRLGVLSGIETLHLLDDLQRYFDIPAIGGGKVRAQVSAFIGETMSFTGEDISMPGSAAVAGRIDVAHIHRMQNGEGERFIDGLQSMLRALKQAQLDGDIRLVNDLAGAADDGLLQACTAPTDFYTPHSYERHIEQGPLLHRAGVPMAMVGTIMGIHQEDIFIEGARAEAAALEINRQLRELIREDRFRDTRITVGIMESCGDSEATERVYPALRCTFEGEMNHAGATPMEDRRDPGVAAARLSRVFFDWYDARRTSADEGLAGLRPEVSNLHLSPGTNRNAIPGSASMTLALVGAVVDAPRRVDEAVQEDLVQTLQGYAAGTLARRVAGGGEGVRLCRIEPVSYTNMYHQARLSIDLRADQQAIIDDCRACTNTIIAHIETAYAVKIRSKLQQKLPPFDLENSGQALLVERSYGGSHNPREMEVLVDIVRGCLLQIAVTRELLARDNLDGLSLFKEVERLMPDEWLNTLRRFTSGALHDTCNIAASALRTDTQ